MTTDFVRTWKSSVLPKKQRKYISNAPLHIRHRFIHAHLSKELRQRYGRRNFSVRVGDRVKVMRGQFAGKTDKVTRVDLKNSRIYIEGIELIKKDGNKVFCSVHPSKLMLVELLLDDKRRVDSLKREPQKKNQKAIKAEPKKESKAPAGASSVGKSNLITSMKENSMKENPKSKKSGGQAKNG